MTTYDDTTTYTYTNLRPAVNAMCKNCVASDVDTDFLPIIEGCMGFSCPLYAVRPVRGSNNKAVAAYSVPQMTDGIIIRDAPIHTHITKNTQGRY
jgi:hypothetical protein